MLHGLPPVQGVARKAWAARDTATAGCAASVCRKQTKGARGRDQRPMKPVRQCGPCAAGKSAKTLVAECRRGSQPTANDLAARQTLDCRRGGGSWRIETAERGRGGNCFEKGDAHKISCAQTVRQCGRGGRVGQCIGQRVLGTYCILVIVATAKKASGGNGWGLGRT